MGRELFFAIALLTGTQLSLAAGLNDGDIVDRIFLNPSTGQPILALSVDQSLDSEAAEKKLDYKLGTYIGYVRSGEIYKRTPKANREQPVVFAFIFEQLPSAAQKAKIFQMRDRLISMGYDVWLKVMDEKTQKNVDLAP